MTPLQNCQKSDLSAVTVWLRLSLKILNCSPTPWDKVQFSLFLFTNTFITCPFCSYFYSLIFNHYHHCCSFYPEFQSSIWNSWVWPCLCFYDFAPLGSSPMNVTLFSHQFKFAVMRSSVQQARSRPFPVKQSRWRWLQPQRTCQFQPREKLCVRPTQLYYAQTSDTQKLW